MTLAQRVMVMNGGVAERLAHQLKSTKSPPACLWRVFRQPGDEPADRPREYRRHAFQLDGGIVLPLNGGYRQYAGRK